MFEPVVDEGAASRDASFEEDWFDPAWLDEAPWLDTISESEATDQVPVSQCAPSGWLALELDQCAVDPARLSDTDLIDAVIGFDRVASWAGARQTALIAEFARRRPGDHPLAARSDAPSRCSEFAPDEIALALRLSRRTAIGRLVMAQTLVADLPAALAAWQAGVIDARKAQAITETSYLLAPEQRAALEARVLPQAGEQTLAQLRAALARAVLAIDPDGAEARHQQRRKDRRVVVGPDGEGMASLWALLSAADATAAYQRPCQLARGLGAADPRGMDARRADLLVELLTGRRCGATATPVDHDCPENCDCPDVPSDPAAPSSVAFSTSTDPADIDSPRIEGGLQGAAASGPTTSGRSHRCGTTKPGKPLVSVVVPITMLLGLDEQPGELVGYGPIPAALAREIAAEGTWRRLLTDPASGTLLDYGRTTYTPPAALADFIRARDLYCRNPLCRQRAATADLDHTIPWPEGTTSEHNLYTGCRHDHLIKTHTPGWHVNQHPDGRVTWTTPTGHTYTSHPHDYRPDHLGQTHPPPETPTPETSESETGVGAEYNPDLDPPPF